MLPWRSLPGAPTDPYAVWLSEIMLQQTTVAAVVPYYERFLKAYPTVRHLAEAPLDDVLSLWAGLGYYSRARNLHACARQIASLGSFPETVAGLQALPGIGAYTARAIASIAFSVPVVPVDGNVERIVARLFALDAPLPGVRRTLDARAATLNTESTARNAPSEFTQALFDLGAGICTPRRPGCLVCPWQDPCLAHKTGTPERFPVRAVKKPKPERYGTVFLLRDDRNAVWARRRPESGLLGGMTELPGTAWLDAPPEASTVDAAAPIEADWQEIGRIRHVFTHFSLQLTVLEARIGRFESLHNQAGFACPEETLTRQAFPSVMRKCLMLGPNGISG